MRYVYPGGQPSCPYRACRALGAGTCKFHLMILAPKRGSHDKVTVFDPDAQISWA